MKIRTTLWNDQSQNFGFFFYASVPLLSLHSFPTRRSSDLRPALRAERGQPLGMGLGSRDRIARRRRGTPPDRKSTRLNSSHVSISYAVFCLKKKIRWLLVPAWKPFCPSCRKRASYFRLSRV